MFVQCQRAWGRKVGSSVQGGTLWLCWYNLTWSLVVADSEVGGHASASVGKTARAVDSGAADLGGSGPDNLGEVAPSVESRLVVDVGWCGLSVHGGEVARFVVVEQLGDDRGDVAGRAAGGDVLAVSTTIGLTEGFGQYMKEHGRRHTYVS